jgi:hypothetical protein
MRRLNVPFLTILRMELNLNENWDLRIGRNVDNFQYPTRREREKKKKQISNFSEVKQNKWTKKKKTATLLPNQLRMRTTGKWGTD